MQRPAGIGHSWHGFLAPGLHRGSPHLASKGKETRVTARKRWSQRVTETSNALDLESGVFALEDPRIIARSLKKSAEQSRRRKSEPFQSAMSMLTFYINRAGRHLPAVQRARLEEAKDELRALYNKPRQRPRQSIQKRT